MPQISTCAKSVCNLLDQAFHGIAPTNPSTDLSSNNGISEQDLEALSPQISAIAGRAIGVNDIRKAKIRYASDLIKLICGTIGQIS